jgi:hypothetical protein
MLAYRQNRPEKRQLELKFGPIFGSFKNVSFLDGLLLLDLVER